MRSPAGRLNSFVSIDPNIPAGRLWQYAHGEHCACLVLAAAVGAGPEAVSCDYCHNVLQKHWTLACDHGGTPPKRKLVSELWRDIGGLDAIKALLVKEV